MAATDPLLEFDAGGGVDVERRFGGLRRLYGDAAYERVRASRIAVIGLGGVGSWAVEALARSGVAALVLIDLDHVAESNINRQIQALEPTIGQAKAVALSQRVAQIHPGCEVHPIEAFVEADNWPHVLPIGVDAVLDACDDPRAKALVAAWARAEGCPVVTVGAAGGKRQPHCVEVADLADVTHDRLLAGLRQRLRKQFAAPPRGALGVRCVFSREAVVQPAQACEAEAGNDGSLNCHGYGSSVVVTSVFGMVAASQVLEQVILAG
jgi:tRNA A37 threonylcarbamoyladenosine dehydratase